MNKKLLLSVIISSMLLTGCITINYNDYTGESKTNDGTSVSVTEGDRPSSVEDNSDSSVSPTEGTTTATTTGKSVQTTTSKMTEAAKKDLGYKFWNGYTYKDNNGNIRYKLETYGDLKLGFTLHCWFRDGDPKWHEEMITLTDLTEGAQQVKVGMVLDNRNNDMTQQFESFVLNFGEDSVIMEVKRNEKTLAGGSESSIQTGTYTLVAP